MSLEKTRKEIDKLISFMEECNDMEITMQQESIDFLKNLSKDPMYELLILQKKHLVTNLVRNNEHLTELARIANEGLTLVDSRDINNPPPITGKIGANTASRVDSNVTINRLRSKGVKKGSLTN